MCYHVWLFADGGSRLNMVRKCWKTRAAANKAQLVEFSRMDDPSVKQRMVLQCQKGCPCKKFRRGCPNC